MLNKYLLFLLLVTAPLVAMEINECTIQMNIDGNEVIKRKVSALLKASDPATQSIIKDLLTKAPTKECSQEQLKQKAVILRKIADSDE